MKPCPYCSEDIKATAVKCKHCGEMLNKRSQPKWKSGAMGCCVGVIVCFLLFLVVMGIGGIGANAIKKQNQELRECLVNCKLLAMALELCASDNGGRYPVAGNLQVLIAGGYLKTIPTCPTDHSAYSYTSTQKPDTFKFNCQGDHTARGISRGFPLWDSEEGLKDK